MGFLARIGNAISAALSALWEEIKHWLNTFAADFVEKTLGLTARNHMQRATVVLDRLVSVVRNTSTIYAKKDPDALYIDKTTMVSEAPVAEFDYEVLSEFRHNNNKLVGEFSYGY